MRIGSSLQQITPRIGLGMAGYDAPNRIATDVLDDLYASILIIEIDHKKLLLIQLDVLSIDTPFYDSAVKIAAKFGITKEFVFVGATHTHSGPQGIMSDTKTTGYRYEEVTGVNDVFLVQNMLSKIEAGIKEACCCLNECSLKVGRTMVNGVASNRNNPSIPCDQILTTYEFISTNGSKILMYNYACHPTVLSYANTKYSSDWVGAVRDLGRLDGYDLVFMTLGCAGEISTRFTRQESTEKEVKRIGSLVYACIQESKKRSVEIAVSTLATFSNFYQLKLKPEVASSTGIKLVDVDALSSHTTINKEICSNELKENYDLIQITTLHLGDERLMFIPSEICSPLTLDIRNKYKDNITINTLFNGCFSYLADKEKFKSNTYEANTSPYQEGEVEKLFEFILERESTYPC